MDWGRAKSILIGIFLALNVFLLVYLKMFYFQSGISKDTISDSQKVLNERGTLVQCEIPSREYKYDSLEFDSRDYSRVKAAERLLGTSIDKAGVRTEQKLEHKSRSIKFKANNELIYLDVNPEDNIDIKNRADVERCAGNFLKSLKLPVGEFKADSIKSFEDSVKVRFYEKYKGFVVFDNWFEITVTKQGVTYMKYRYIKVKALKNDEQKNVIPAHTLLLRHFTGGSQVITEIDIGFRKPKEKEEVFIWFSEPYWRVRLENGQDRYFNALTGSEESEIAEGAVF